MIEMQFSLGDQWSRQLFLALCRRYGLKPYRLHRQRRTTVMLKAPKSFIEQVLWPEFQQLDEALRRYLSEVTTRIIREEVHKTSAKPQRSIPPRRCPPDQPDGGSRRMLTATLSRGHRRGCPKTYAKRHGSTILPQADLCGVSVGWRLCENPLVC